MKKNIMMRIASILLVCVLATTCGISGTFAKYVTSDTAGDTARVAKWGVKVIVTSEAFSDSYLDEATTYTPDEAVDTITVQADTKDVKIFAPGTKGVLCTVALEGTPEVDGTVNFEFTTLNFEGWRDEGGKFYCPLIITVGTTPLCGLNYTSPSAFRDAIMAAVNTYDVSFHTNDDLSLLSGASLEITWEWPFESYIGGVICDKQDTYLGDCAAGAILGKTAATIDFELTVTVTQVN